MKIFINIYNVIWKAETEDNSPQEEQLEPLLKDQGLEDEDAEKEGANTAQEESPDQSISSAMPIESDRAPVIQDGMISLQTLW